ncbi:MAG: hypothetical protein IJ503_04200 [Akkermansia sp.]|nr:hypothetical protein [Akkermansia sp.]
MKFNTISDLRLDSAFQMQSDRGVTLKSGDAVRLIQEAGERLGEVVMGKNKTELISMLRRVIELGVAAVKAETATERFEVVAWASVEARSGRRPATQQDLRHFVRRMLRVEGVAERPLRAMSTRECRSLLERAFGGSVHSYRKGRAILHSIFAYGIRHEWCDVNPVDRIEVPPVKETIIRPLTLPETKRLRETAEQVKHQSMRLSLYLMMYCGVRPAEVGRIVPERDILWRERQLIIRPGTSKTGGGRVVPLRKLYLLRKAEAVIPRNWMNRWRELRHAAGLHDWRPDTLRHTFATYHALYFRNLEQLRLEMGHRDVDLLRSRYVLAVGRSAAVRFWRE